MLAGMEPQGKKMHCTFLAYPGRRLKSGISTAMVVRPLDVVIHLHFQRSTGISQMSVGQL